MVTGAADGMRHCCRLCQAPGSSKHGTWLLGATLLDKVNASTSARLWRRLVSNGMTEIRGLFGEVSGTHVSLATALWFQTMVALSARNIVELLGYFEATDGYFASDHTSFWGVV